jgi:hypothetical protein
MHEQHAQQPKGKLGFVRVFRDTALMRHRHGAAKRAAIAGTGIAIHSKIPSALKSPDYLFLAILLTMVWSAVNGKQFSADGAFYFVQILETQDFTYIAWHRQFANYLTQWPLVLALHLGVSAPTFLRLVFGIGHVYPFLLAYLVLRWQIRQGAAQSLLYTYLFGLLAITLPSDFVLMGEHQLLLPLCWPILAFLLEPRRFSLSAWFLPLTLSFLLTRIYEPVIAAFGLFFVILITSSRKELVQIAEERNYRLLWAVSVCVVLWMVGCGIALDGIVHPRDPANRTAFLSAIGHVVQNPVLAITAVALVLFVLGSRFRRSQPILLLVLLSLTYVIWLKRFAIFSAQISFDSRVLVFLLMPGIIATSAWPLRNTVLTGNQRLWFAAIFIAPVLADLAGTNVWQDFAERVSRLAMCEEQGLVPASVHQLDRHPASWNWTFPSLSIVLGAPTVGSVLENNENVKWQPFDPKVNLPLPLFAGYHGVLAAGERTAPGEEVIHGSARRCISSPH